MKFNIYNTWLPKYISNKMIELYGTRYINNKNQFQISSHRFRTLNENIKDCKQKLYQLIKDCYYTIPNDTSIDKKHKILKFKEQNRLKNRKFKELKKYKKATKKFQEK